MKTKAAATKDQLKIQRDMRDYKSKGGQVEELGVTELKPTRFIINSKEPQSMERTKPVRVL